MWELVKLSEPGWEKRFRTKEEAAAELLRCICHSCLIGETGDAVANTSDIDELLATSCGAEYDLGEMESGKVDDLSKILCPFCSTPWSSENIRVYEVDSSDQCESGRFEPPTYSISISCHACKREMYRKEGAYAEY